MLLRQINSVTETDQFNLILDLINNQIIDLIFKKVTGLKFYANST